MRTGVPLPLGAYLYSYGANFAMFSRHTLRIWLELYARSDNEKPTRTIELKLNVYRHMNLSKPRHRSFLHRIKYPVHPHGDLHGRR